MTDRQGRTERVILTCTLEEVAAINQWRRVNGLKTMSAAFRDLIARGLQVVGNRPRDDAAGDALPKAAGLGKPNS